MLYQVVARSYTSAGEWDYYPYWAPTRDKDAAARLANHATNTGHEAAILQSVTLDMLQSLSCGVVDRQDVDLLPALRYLPDARLVSMPNSNGRAMVLESEPVKQLGATFGWPPAAVLDVWRLQLEMGSGGDVTCQPGWQAQPITFPVEWNVLRAWLGLRRQLEQRM